ncbi:hypothetical protein [Amycolatopsis sp. WAC 04169]|uniref:hypothetical protein n=1 Tax=Amycolatopsis sp. WAC 04169 TaxID=2203197 RepID=UPI0026A77BE4
MLVLRGEPGIGKSALLDHVGEATAGEFQLIRASGSEFEGELPFAALHQLCVPALAHLDTLSGPYRESLLVAFGLADDAHWLDTASARALTFLARRIAAEPIAMVFAARDRDPVRGLDELPGLTIGGLSDAHARAVLAGEKTVTGPITHDCVDFRSSNAPKSTQSVVTEPITTRHRLSGKTPSPGTPATAQEIAPQDTP